MSITLLALNILILYFTMLGVLLALYFPVCSQINRLTYLISQNKSKHASIEEQIELIEKAYKEAKEAEERGEVNSLKAEMSYFPIHIKRYKKIKTILKFLTFGVFDFFV